MFSNLMYRLRALFRRNSMEAELEAELRAHVEQQAEKYVQAGMSPKDAARRAKLEFGGIEQVKEECRDTWGVRFISELAQDLRYGLRQFRRNPGFTAVAVITLALGIGANTAIFSAVNNILLQSLPYPNSSRIVDITHNGDVDSLPMFNYWAENNPGFQDLAAYTASAISLNLNGSDRPEAIEVLKVSQKYFTLLGANPILGRTFNTAEDRPGGPQVLVMSYGLWERRFGGNTRVLGNTITLGGTPYVVVGVLSPSFMPYPAADAWIPLQADPASTDQAHTLMVSGLLPEGTTLAKANSWMKTLGKLYVQTHPQQLGGDEKLRVIPLQRWMTGEIRPALLILLGAVGLVLLIVCANVANLLLARALGREKEIAIRSAVGANRTRIVRQLLTESGLLALTGGVMGIALGSLGVRILMTFAPNAVSRVQGIMGPPTLDPSVTTFAVVLIMVTGILFGLAPALQLSKPGSFSGLGASILEVENGSRRHRLRNALVVCEVAAAAILACGALLLIRSFVAMHRVNLGFEAQNLLMMRVPLAGPDYNKGVTVARLSRLVSDRLDGIPGVESATLGSSMPFGPISDMIFDIPGRPPLEGYKFTGDVLWSFVSPSYFQTLRIPLLSGRYFSEEGPPHTVIINEAMAHKFWRKKNPVGQSIMIGAGLGPSLDQGPTEIVGIVGNVRDRFDATPPATMYQLWGQIPDAGLRLISGLFPASIAVRTEPRVAPMNVAKAVQNSLLAEGVQLPTEKMGTMEQSLRESTAQANFNLSLLSAFAAMALLMAAIGIYGVMAFSVTQRTHEIGIRMALGAEKNEILRMVVGQGLKLALIGVAVGIAGAFALTRFLSSLLYGVRPTDPLTFIAVSLILIAVALMACYIPARRAAKVDPMVALRYE